MVSVEGGAIHKMLLDSDEAIEGPLHRNKSTTPPVLNDSESLDEWPFSLQARILQIYIQKNSILKLIDLTGEVA